jgi:hypothetical protein
MKCDILSHAPTKWAARQLEKDQKRQGLEKIQESYEENTIEPFFPL